MKLTTFLFLLLLSSSLYSHPHMFITSKSSVVFNSEKLEGIFVEWTFDDMFSETIISEYDKDKSRSFSVKETAVIKRNAFDYVAESKYFIDLKINGKVKTVNKVENFIAKIKKNRLVYRFYVPLNIKASKKEAVVNFSVFDETFYIAFDVKKPEVETNVALTQSVTVKDYGKATDYYGQRPSKDIVVKFKKEMKRLILLLIILAVFVNLAAGGNPFLSKKANKKNTEQVVNKPATELPFMEKIIKIQRKLNSKLSLMIRETKEDPSFGTILLALIISFIYGMIHSLGPGHGKIFATSYFLSNRSKYLNGVILGFSTGIIHALSAIISVTLLYFILSNGSMKNIDELNITMQKISYFVIILVGGFLLYSSLKHKHDKNEKKNRSLMSIAIAVGIVPCPGTTIVLVFSMTLGIYIFGVALAGAMALGMGTTISLAGLFAIFFNRQGKKLSLNIVKSGAVLEKALNVLGAIVIILLGSILFIGTL